MSRNHLDDNEEEKGGVTGIFGILLHLHMPLQYIIMMAISFGVSFAVTWVIWSPEEVKA